MFRPASVHNYVIVGLVPQGYGSQTRTREFYERMEEKTLRATKGTINKKQTRANRDEVLREEVHCSRLDRAKSTATSRLITGHGEVSHPRHPRMGVNPSSFMWREKVWVVCRRDWANG